MLCSGVCRNHCKGAAGVGVWYFHFFGAGRGEVPLEQKFPEVIIVSLEGQR